RYLPT
uniref:Proctolin n=3 Tax=Arthropoda TaxID=6656 RepID=PRCT_LIMPO